MLGKKIILGIIVVLIVFIFSFGCFFYFTGGMALVRVVKNYLMVNYPKKDYTWQDFSDRRFDQNISGFYAWGGKDSFSMWTLSGLKTFYKNPQLGQYFFSPICEMINSKSTNDDKNKLTIDEIETGDFDMWRSYIKSEYLVTVLRQNGSKNVVAKLWSMSGKYKVLNFMDTETCN